MPTIYDDYKIICPFYGSTRGLRIVCHKGYSIEFKTEEQMKQYKECNCKRIEKYSCRARKVLMAASEEQKEE